MGGKVTRMRQASPVAELKDGDGGRDVAMDQQSKEVLAADLRKLAREKGVARCMCPWGELWMEAKVHGTKYNWRYRVVLLDPKSRAEIFVVRESTHPTMVDIAVSMVLRLAALGGDPMAHASLRGAAAEQYAVDHLGEQRDTEGGEA